MITLKNSWSWRSASHNSNSRLQGVPCLQGMSIYGTAWGYRYKKRVELTLRFMNCFATDKIDHSVNALFQ